MVFNTLSYLTSPYFILIDVNLVGHDGQIPLHTAARYEILHNFNITDRQTKSIIMVRTISIELFQLFYSFSYLQLHRMRLLF